MLFPPTASATANWTEAFVRPSPFRGRHRSLSACHPLGGNPSECKTRIRARLRWRIVFASSVENLASSHHRGSYVRKQVRASQREHHSRSRDSNSSSPQCRFDSSGDRRAPDAASLRARPAPHAQRPNAGLQRRSCCWRPVRLLFAQALLRPIALRTGSPPPRAAPALVAQAPRPVLLAPHRLSAGNGCVVWGGVGGTCLDGNAVKEGYRDALTSSLAGCWTEYTFCIHRVRLEHGDRNEKTSSRAAVGVTM